MVLPEADSAPTASKKRRVLFSTGHNGISNGIDGKTGPNGMSSINDNSVINGNSVVNSCTFPEPTTVEGTEDTDDLAPELENLKEAEETAAKANAEENKVVRNRVVDKRQTFEMLQKLLERSGIYAELILKRMKEEEERENSMKAKSGSGPSKRGPKRKKTSATTAKYADYFSKKDLQSIKSKCEAEAVPDLKTVNQEATDGESTKTGSTTTPALFTGGTLRSYQLDGLQWLKAQYEYGINGILGDEMGLGKTIQCIALISYLYGEGVSGPFLICGPLSTLPNWKMEFERFTPEIPVVLYHGHIDQRKKIRKDIKKERVTSWNGKKVLPVVLTSYEMIIRDCRSLSLFQWKHLIIDEAQRVKNFRCQLIQKLKGFSVDSRLLLTGTPVQNNLAELWSLLNFLLPDVFVNLEWFEELFGYDTVYEGSLNGPSIGNLAKEEEENQMLSKLHRILAPFLLRRLKNDVELDLPKKKEVIVYAPMTPLQTEYYKAGVEKTIVGLFREDKASDWMGPNDAKLRSSNKTLGKEKVSRGSVIQNLNCVRSPMMMFRKITMHPYLLENPLVPGTTSEFLIDENLVLKSGKMLVLDRLLPALRNRGHKVLLFSTMTQMIDILMDYCELRNFNFCRLDGSMSLDDRQIEIKRFNSDPDYFLFMISTRAGGLGLNLMAADTVIIFDSDWNPQVDLQAQDRCHRIGQTKPVIVYRLVARGTIDDRIIERATAKRRLEKMVIHTEKFKQLTEDVFTGTIPPLSAAELKELLKATDYNECWDTSSRGNDVLSDEDLEKLLDRGDLVKA